MSGAGWVAGSVRARLLARHSLGTDGARDVAASGSLAAACARLSGSAYGRSAIHTGTAATVQHAIWATVVWDLRVLAGWLPGPGVGALRVFAGFFEIANIEEQLAFLEDGDRPDPFDLGGLGTVWTRAREATSVGELRSCLHGSPWRDPGSDDRAQILAALRLEWARRVGEIDGAAAWGAGAAALVVARSLTDGWAPIPDDVARRAPALGRRAASASTFADFVAALPESARWVFEGIDAPGDLWRAEAAWWRRLDVDGARRLRGERPGPDIVVGAVARRLADAWRACAALDIASRGGSAQDLVDVVA